MGEKKFVVSFHTTSDAMSCEQVCEQSGLEGRLIPVPRDMSAGCGIAWETAQTLSEKTLAVLSECGVEWEDTALI